MRSKDTNFFLSESDIEFLSDKSIFHKKQQVSNRILELFGILESEIRKLYPEYMQILPEGVTRKNGKISRGENYRGLPWIVLDCPAVFGKDGVFAYRTLFWWGHPFSFTFQLSGKYLGNFVNAVAENLNTFGDDTLVCINASQWEHHQESTNYIPVSEFTNLTRNNRSGNSTGIAEYFLEKGFLKITKTVALKQHQQLSSTGTDFLERLLGSMK